MSHTRWFWERFLLAALMLLSCAAFSACTSSDGGDDVDGDVTVDGDETEDGDQETDADGDGTEDGDGEIDDEGETDGGEDGDVDLEGGEDSYTATRFIEVSDPAFGSSTEIAFEMPRFDSEGGTRTLLSVDLAYTLLTYTSLDVKENTLDEMAIKETYYTFEWIARDGEARLLPATVDLHSGPFFVGYEAFPHEEAGIRRIDGIGVNNSETLVDAALLATLTGEAPLPLTAVFTLSEPSEPEPPGIAERGVWVPDLYEVTVTRLTLDLEVTFRYSY